MAHLSDGATCVAQSEMLLPKSLLPQAPHKGFRAPSALREWGLPVTAPDEGELGRIGVAEADSQAPEEPPREDGRGRSQEQPRATHRCQMPELSQ